MWSVAGGEARRGRHQLPLGRSCHPVSEVGLGRERRRRTDSSVSCRDAPKATSCSSLQAVDDTDPMDVGARRSPITASAPASRGRPPDSRAMAGRPGRRRHDDRHAGVRTA